MGTQNSASILSGAPEFLAFRCARLAGWHGHAPKAAQADGLGTQRFQFHGPVGELGVTVDPSPWWSGLGSCAAACCFFSLGDPVGTVAQQTQRFAVSAGSLLFLKRPKQISTQSSVEVGNG